MKKLLNEYKGHTLSLIVRLLVYLSAIFTMCILFFLIAYILIKGIPNLSLDLFAWNYDSTNVSMMPSIINTLLMTVLTLLFAVPVGVGSAIYMVEYAKKGNNTRYTFNSVWSVRIFILCNSL